MLQLRGADRGGHPQTSTPKASTTCGGFLFLCTGKRLIHSHCWGTLPTSANQKDWEIENILELPLPNLPRQGSWDTTPPIMESIFWLHLIRKTGDSSWSSGAPAQRRAGRTYSLQSKPSDPDQPYYWGYRSSFVKKTKSFSCFWATPPIVPKQGISFIDLLISEYSLQSVQLLNLTGGHWKLHSPSNSPVYRGTWTHSPACGFANCRAKLMDSCGQGIQYILWPDSGSQSMTCTGSESCPAALTGQGS